LIAALIVVTMVGAACAPAKPTGAGATAAPTQTAQPAPATSAPTVARPAARVSDLPAGVDAAGNFYRGDPNAAVKLVEFSDFQ
jgi:hypothetical protein